MASRPWEPHELAVLEEVANRHNWLNEAESRLPGRSGNALRFQMMKLRETLGIKAIRGRPSLDGWMLDAVSGSQMLLARLELTGLRP